MMVQADGRIVHCNTLTSVLCALYELPGSDKTKTAACAYAAAFLLRTSANLQVGRCGSGPRTEASAQQARHSLTAVLEHV